MRDFVAPRLEAAADVREDRHQHVVAIKVCVAVGIGLADFHLGVQPAEQRFPEGVAVIIDFGDRGRLRGVGEQVRKPGIETGAVAGGTFDDGRVRIHRCERGCQPLPPRRVDQIALVDNDELRFFELLAVDVGHVFRELRGSESEHAFGSQRIDQHAHRRHGEAIAVDLLKWQGHRRDEVGAAPHRFGKQHVGRCLPRE